MAYPDRLTRSTLPGIAARETWKDDVSAFLAKIVGWSTDTRFVRQNDPFGAFVIPRSAGLVLDGFFQNREWWTPTWQSVARDILALEPPAVTERRREGGAALKLRRSDYVGRGIVLADAFYRDAMRTLGLHDQAVTVVCEDRSAFVDAQRLLAEFGCVAREPEAFTGNRNIDDFWNLAVASTQVVANSSYSWWAAAVAQVVTEHVRVAYPDPWLPDPSSANPMPDMGINGWVRVPAEFE